MVGLVPQPRQVPPAPFDKEDLQRVFFDVNRVHSYSQFAFLPGESGAQLTNSLEDRVLVTPGLVQLVLPVPMTGERARQTAVDVFKAVCERLKLDQFIQAGIKIVAHFSAPGEHPDARAFVSERLMAGSERVAELGPDFFGGGVKYRRIAGEREDNLLIEPWVADNQFIWVDYDVQRMGPFAGLDGVSEWIDDAFEFVRGPAKAILEV